MFRLQTSEPYFAVGLEPIATRVYLLGVSKLIIFFANKQILTAKISFHDGDGSRRLFVITHFCLPCGNGDFAQNPYLKSYKKSLLILLRFLIKKEKETLDEVKECAKRILLFAKFAKFAVEKRKSRFTHQFLVGIFREIFS